MRWHKKVATETLIVLSLAPTPLFAQSIAALRQKAAEGDAVAMRQLAQRYGKGDGVPEDQHQWLRWMRMAAEHGDTVAMANVGSLYLVGEYVPQNYQRAFVWLHKAAENGNSLAMSNLGVMYEMGDGVAVNYTEAYFWLDIATANPSSGIKSEELRHERDDVASKLSPAALAAVQERATKWMDAHLSVGASTR